VEDRVTQAEGKEASTAWEVPQGPIWTALRQDFGL
jgi:hypothetical protein